MSNPNPPAPDVRAPRWLVWLGVLALAGYGAYLATHTTIVAGGSDSSGYLNSARLLASGRLQGDLRVPAEFGPPEALKRLQFSPQGFYAYEGNPHVTPTYPTGLPLHFALAGNLLGWRAGPLVVELGAALAAVWLCYAVARAMGLARALAAAGAVALAASPVFIFTSIQPLSDTLATAWCLAAVLAALKARGHRSWAAACGAACAVAVLVRPTNVVILPALFVLLGADWRRLALAAHCGLPGVAWLASYNHALYGSALNSGYGDWRAAFALHYGAATALHFAKWLATLLPAAVLALPLAALTHRDTRTRSLIACAVWFGAITSVYAFYEVSHEVWWCLRFILPAMPALILASLLGVDALARRLAPTRAELTRNFAACLIAAWAVGGSIYWTRQLGVHYMKGYEQVYADACAAAAEKFPAGTLLVTSSFSGAVYYYTDFPILRWEEVDAPQFAHFVALARKAGRSVGALNFESQDPTVLREKCPGNWVQVARVKNATLWRLLESNPP
jgi:hypothetical protein